MRRSRAGDGALILTTFNWPEPRPTLLTAREHEVVLLVGETTGKTHVGRVLTRPALRGGRRPSCSPPRPG